MCKFLCASQKVRTLHMFTYFKQSVSEYFSSQSVHINYDRIIISELDLQTSGCAKNVHLRKICVISEKVPVCYGLCYYAQPGCQVLYTVGLYAISWNMNSSVWAIWAAQASNIDEKN